MTSKELNLKLIESFPEIKNTYLEETSWQDGDETGSHVVYEDIFMPFLKKQIIDNNEKMLVILFDYIEGLLELNDEYADEVVALSVIESLLFDEDIDNVIFIKYVKPKTLALIEEIIQGL